MFLDINLPDISGHDVLARLRDIDPQIYAVMLSGHTQSENVMEALKMGAKGFVSKPFTKEKLLQYIAKCPKKQLMGMGL